jgi:hypothetical protein
VCFCAGGGGLGEGIGTYVCMYEHA